MLCCLWERGGERERRGERKEEYKPTCGFDITSAIQHYVHQGGNVSTNWWHLVSFVVPQPVIVMCYLSGHEIVVFRRKK